MCVVQKKYRQGSHRERCHVIPYGRIDRGRMNPSNLELNERPILVHSYRFQQFPFYQNMPFAIAVQMLFDDIVLIVRNQQQCIADAWSSGVFISRLPER